jgi:four helix bundle protein
MKYERFEQLPVWQAGIELAVQTYAMTAKPVFRRHHSLRDQIERAAVSVSNNIAEGFERGTNQELLTFLYIARGSAGEVRSMLCLLERMSDFCNLESEGESGERLKATGRLDSIDPELRHEGSALRDGANAPGARRSGRAQAILGGAEKNSGGSRGREGIGRGECRCGGNVPYMRNRSGQKAGRWTPPFPAARKRSSVNE